MRTISRRRFLGGVIAGSGALAAGKIALANPKGKMDIPVRQNDSSGNWWKGSIHCHVAGGAWGPTTTESVAGCYKDLGYHFLAISDYSAIADLTAARAAHEEAGRFHMFPNEEIIDWHGGTPVHLNPLNVAEVILPEGGDTSVTTLEVMQRNIDKMIEQRDRIGRRMIITMNHPNYGYPLTAEDLMVVNNLNHFEIYNGYTNQLPELRGVFDGNNPIHASTLRMWDIALTFRLEESNGRGLIYAVAVDDTHNYHYVMPPEGHAADGVRDFVETNTPGRAWVVVRAAELTTDAILEAMEEGDYYCSTGVELQELQFNGQRLSLQIAPETGATYTTQFIGTREGYDPTYTQQNVGYPVTGIYSDDIGEVLAEEVGLTPSYTLTGDEIYVRAQVFSTKLKENPAFNGEKERCWTQPFIPKNESACVRREMMELR